MTAHTPSRYFRMAEDARATLKRKARERYYANADVHRLKRYLHCLNAGKVQCPKEVTRKRHCIELQDGMWRQVIQT